MTLEEFIEVVRKEVEAFKTDWLEHQQIEPEGFPTEMDEEDWWEQYRSYTAISSEEL